jgi:GNAT superfamily N-acetyltransferase
MRVNTACTDGSILANGNESGAAMSSLATTQRTAIGDAMEWTERLRDSSVIKIRPIGPADADRERAFLERLSPEYRAYRFLGLIKASDASVVRELTQVDPACEVALVAIVESAEGDREIGVARYRASSDNSHCDSAVTVDPAWQQRGVGSVLMRHLIEVAHGRGIRRMYSADAARCEGAHLLAERLGFHSRPDPEDPLITTFELTLA